MFCRDDRGAAAVEFALILPLLVTLLMGVAEFGRAYNIQTTLSAAARDAVRVMALQNNPAGARAAARAAASPVVTLTDAQIVVTPTSCVATATAPTATATVRIVYGMNLLLFPDDLSVTLTGRGTMRCNG